MKERIPVKIRPEDYILDNRDDRLTEIHIDRGDEYLIIEVLPYDLMANVIENLPLPRKTIKRYRKTLNRLDAEIELTVREQIEEDMKQEAIMHLVSAIEDNGFTIPQFVEILKDQIA